MELYAWIHPLVKFVANNKVGVTTTEFEILRVLLENKGKVVDQRTDENGSRTRMDGI